MSALPLTDQEFRAAVELAARAPSLHNSQPWRFRRVGDDAVELRSDPARAVPIGDPTGRGARVACGAALLNLRLALAVANRPSAVEPIPDRADPSLLARVTLGAPRPPSSEERELAASIPRRRSQRNPFLDAVVPPTHRAAMATAAAAERGVLLFVTEPAAVADVADLIHAASTVLGRQPGYLDELRSWTRQDPASTDGVLRSAAGPAPAPHELLERRDFGGDPAPAHRRYEDRPLIAVLASFGDSPREQVDAGQALQRVLLTATKLGLVASMLSQPIEVPDVRQRLATLLGRRVVPQMVLRMGFGIPGPPTPRRPAHEVIDAAADVPGTPARSLDEGPLHGAPGA
jgi:nitroreductase